MITVLSLALLAASAPQDAPGPNPAPAAEAPKKEKPICRKQVSTGSRLGGTRLCKTRAEWAAISARNRGIEEGAGRVRVD